ncbi:MAG: hypothetical protein ACXVA9_13785 [Bdellovibrionales bacterium]
MSKLLIFVSATFVLIFSAGPCFASPQDQAPNSPAPESPGPTKPIDEDLSISTPPSLKYTPAPIDSRYYPYQQQLTFRYGQASDLPKIHLNDNVTGFQYLFPKFLSPKLEAGADLHDEGRGHIFAGARWIYHERSYFRPSLKLSLDHLINATENLATLTLIDNLYFRTSATLEWVVWNPYSLRFEAELLIGTKNSIGEMTLGLSRGW